VNTEEYSSINMNMNEPLLFYIVLAIAMVVAAFFVNYQIKVLRKSIYKKYGLDYEEEKK
tara:strand:+ start:504 stop:680 length:177 start_codon:yes stop_codon:yes gene_type:complete